MEILNPVSHTLRTIKDKNFDVITFKVPVTRKVQLEINDPSNIHSCRAYDSRRTYDSDHWSRWVEDDQLFVESDVEFFLEIISPSKVHSPFTKTRKTKRYTTDVNSVTKQEFFYKVSGTHFEIENPDPTADLTILPHMERNTSDQITLTVSHNIVTGHIGIIADKKVDGIIVEASVTDYVKSIDMADLEGTVVFEGEVITKDWVEEKLARISLLEQTVRELEYGLTLSKNELRTLKLNQNVRRLSTPFNSGPRG